MEGDQSSFRNTELVGAERDSQPDLNQQLQAWKENPSWTDPPPEVTVSVPKGSLCNIKLTFPVGLPPEAVYNIITDPGNKRVFKNIKEVISRRVAVDEGHRQVVELEQSAIWRFLWFSGTFSVFVVVDQNRSDLSMKFWQTKAGFMRKFEGSWAIEPLVDGVRVGSKVSLEQLIEPSVVPPGPFAWYLRGIAKKTVEEIATDLMAEAARLRAGGN